MKRQVLVIFVCISCFIKQCTNQHLNENQDNLRVKTNVGDFKGLYFTTEFGTEKYQVLRFLGIRYAKKTTGKLRFMKPEPFTYSEPHEARHYGSSCPQIDMMGLGVDSEDEDCLFLNLFIPTEAPDRETGHSVVVFIHGGGFEFGSSSVFPGDSLAALGNIIVVTFNYRIGIFGFLNTGDETFRGNAGLWDQRLAIKWVKDHIRNFGGDPDRITILGESSGAMSAVIHGMYPENKGLFQNIIAISGTPFTPPGLPSNNLISAQYFAQLVVCYPNGESFRKCMQDADISYLMQSVRYAAEDVDKWSRLNFFPTVDGELIKQDPINRLKQDQSFLTNEVKFLRSLNLIVGLNDAEGGMWVMHMGNDSTGSSISNEDMTEFIIPDTLPFVIDFEQNIPSLTKKLVQAEYSNWENPKDARMQYVKFKGDINYNVPAISLAQFHSDHNAAKTWLFKLDALLNKHVLPTPVWLEKAIHGDILVPLFGFHANFTYGQFRHVFKYEPEEWELQLSMRLITYISNFIRTGYVYVLIIMRSKCTIKILSKRFFT